VDPFSVASGSLWLKSSSSALTGRSGKKNLVAKKWSSDVRKQLAIFLPSIFLPSLFFPGRMTFRWSSGFSLRRLTVVDAFLRDCRLTVVYGTRNQLGS
jgi:hypothetical protein